MVAWAGKRIHQLEQITLQSFDSGFVDAVVAVLERRNALAMSVRRAKILHTMARCSKYRYRDRIGALLALARVRHQDKSGRAKIEQRAYRCPKCGSWHLTSQAQQYHAAPGAA